MTCASKCALLIDFGSTYTKLRAVDLDGGRIIGSGQGSSTVSTDVTVGMRMALADLERRVGSLPKFRYRLASSSAAGGLRMVTVGLVKELTAEAARRAALGAGAKLIGAYAYELTRNDVQEICAMAPDILLLTGGTDGGDSRVILHNAKLLADSTLTCPTVVAGNRSAGDEVAELFRGRGKTVLLTGNVMPEFGRLDIEPARAAIRQVFIDRIVHAKGIDRARDMFDRVLMPTPAAVLQGASLLAGGTSRNAGLGSIVIVDVGGATTDVHSICRGDPSSAEVVLYGLPEPFAKRTVEGDLGMRHNAQSIVEDVGLAPLAADVRLDEKTFSRIVDGFARDIERVPSTADEHDVDEALARAAVRLAVKRHSGTLETVYTAMGPATLQRGKDLSAVDVVVGTGGPLAHARNPARILQGALADTADPLSLRPKAPRFLLDSAYMLYAVGLLAEVEADLALHLGLAHLTDLNGDTAPRRAVPMHP